jgi:pyrimidine operon attenuation protein/uracil phosphoribosyltransferase
MTPARARPTPLPADERLVLDADAIRRAVRRIGHQMLEAHPGASGIVLVGVHTRGVPLARRLADAIADIEDVEVPTGTLDVTLYRDDYARIGPRPLERTHVPVDLSQRTVIIVDDVLYTGRTVRAAMEALIEHGRPAAIELAVLVDRGHRELPITADYVGKNLPTAADEVVRVRVAELDGTDAVTIGSRA